MPHVEYGCYTHLLLEQEAELGLHEERVVVTLIQVGENNVGAELEEKSGSATRGL